MRKIKHTVSRYLLVITTLSIMTVMPVQGRADGAVNYEGLADVKVSTLGVDDANASRVFDRRPLSLHLDPM